MENQGKCEAIDVPENAYLEVSSYRSGWMCERGYQRQLDHCVLVTPPTNAHINFAGDGWECNQPYLEESGRCVLQLARIRD